MVTKILSCNCILLLQPSRFKFIKINALKSAPNYFLSKLCTLVATFKSKFRTHYFKLYFHHSDLSIFIQLSEGRTVEGWEPTNQVMLVFPVTFALSPPPPSCALLLYLTSLFSLRLRRLVLKFKVQSVLLKQNECLTLGMNT